MRQKAFSFVGKKPKSATAAEKQKFLAAQTLFLSMRGPSYKTSKGIDYDSQKGGTITFATYHELARADGTLSEDEVRILADRLKSRDPIYNPCDLKRASEKYLDIPKFVDSFKDENYTCHRVKGNLHVYKLTSADYSSKLNAVMQVLETAEASNRGGPRLMLTEAADESRGFALAETLGTAGTISADVFAPAYNENVSSGAPQVEAFNKVTDGQSATSYARPSSPTPGNDYVLGIDGNQQRTKNSLFEVGAQGSSTVLGNFEQVGSQQTGLGVDVTQSVRSDENGGYKGTAYDAVVDGTRRTQVWLPQASPGIDGFKAAFPQATNVTASRLQGVQGGGAIEQYSYTDANGKNQHALGIGGIPDSDSKTEGSQGLFVPLETGTGKNSNSAFVTDAGRATAKKYVESLTTPEQTASAASVFDQAAGKTMQNSDTAKGPVGMGYFSTIMPDQSRTAAEATTIDKAVAKESEALAAKTAAQNKQERASLFSSNSKVKPILDEEGNPVFAASRTIETRNVDTGGGGNLDRVVIRTNANIGPEQSQKLVNEVLANHNNLLENQVIQARKTLKNNSKLKNSTIPGESEEYKSAKEAVTKAENKLYIFNNRNRPDFLEGNVDQLNRSIDAATDDRSRQSLTQLRDRQLAALTYAKRLRKTPLSFDVAVDAQGNLIEDLNWNNKSTLSPSVRAGMQADFNREIEAAKRIADYDPSQYGDRVQQIKERYYDDGLTSAYDD